MSEYTILIVDDHKPHLLLTEMALQEEGYSYISVSNGKEGIEIARQRSPQLILLALNMQHIDGYEILSELKSYPATTHIPVITTSHYQDFPHPGKSFLLGAIEHFYLPVKAEELACRIRHHYEMYRLEQARRRLEFSIESHNVLSTMLTQAIYSPLNSLKIVNSSLLRMVNKNQIGEDGYELLQTMNQTTVEMSLHLSNMQQIIKLSQHKLKAHKQIADINSIIDEAVETYRPVAAIQNIAITTRGLDEDLTGKVDIDMIRTILYNLLSNAIKFNHPGGTISVASSSVPNGSIQVSIKDTGIGIGQDKIEKLFVANLSDTTELINEWGSGLGLIISRASVELHEGRIWAESEEGKGATLFFSLKATMEETD